ncbi:WW domain-binding 4, partial, partial [Paramuricea clavata]
MSSQLDLFRNIKIQFIKYYPLAALKAYKKDIGYSNYSKAKDLKNETIPKQEHKIESCCAENAGASNSENGDWAAYQTPEGYWYYFNNQTGESRWDSPEGFSFSGQQQNQQTLGNSSEQSSGEQTNEVVRNDEAADQSMEENNRHNSPFGKWETVAVYE